MATEVKILISGLLALIIGFGTIYLLPAIELNINFWPQIIIFCVVTSIAMAFFYSLMPPPMKED